MSLDAVTTTAGNAVISAPDGGGGLSPLAMYILGVLCSVIAVLYYRNQKQNDDNVQIMRDMLNAFGEAKTVIAVLSERIENALRNPKN